ncbi:MAG: TIGR03013 family PEP-CTERM/XrtA system glycosyltransferase [Alteraurantiacibacter sp.]|nr:TIGR03013 family PEP-CTERM/XrtA system glycosyltransferase [Alteraurantiacibacter sp.]
MVRLFKHYVPHAVLFLGIVDFALLLTANNLAWILRATQIGMDPGGWIDRLPTIAGIATVTITAMVAVGVYGAEALRSNRFAAARLLVAVSLAVLALAFLDFLLPGQTYWRSILLYGMSLSILFLMLNRLIVGRILGNAAFRRRVLVLGAGARAKRVQDLSQRPESSFTVVGYVAMGAVPPLIADAVPRSTIDDLQRHVTRLGASEVVLAIEERRNSLPLKDLLRIKTLGAQVNDFSSFLERETGRVDLDTLNPSWLIFSDGFSAGRMISGATKRAFDIVASLLLLLIAWPLIALFALLVKLDSPGPAFFRQTRIGLYGQPFTLIKLRSMQVDAERDGAQWAKVGDPRVTRVGAIIRKLRIDELPQAWTVLKGEMSFVGPRPEVPQFVEDLEKKLPYYAERHMVKPGITGWAQINYPYGASIEDARHKLEYDLYYAKNYTPFLDLLIMLQTLRVVLWPEGAR